MWKVRTSQVVEPVKYRAYAMGAGAALCWGNFRRSKGAESDPSSAGWRSRDDCIHGRQKIRSTAEKKS